jgi:ElaB/YqjD/DUF883 family membrane-anchored ribosome-binding protein
MSGSGSTMQDTTGSMANEARDAASQIYDASGNVIQRGREQAQGAADQVGSYIREQPFTAVLIALGVGYLLGRLHVI